MNPFLAEIRIFAFDFAPKNWAQCNGQILPISQNTALFSLIGTYYGGNGTSNFGLPNLAACVPICAGTGPGLSTYDLGENGGASIVTITDSEMLRHSHAFVGATDRTDSQTAARGQFGTAASGPPNQADVVNLYSTRDPTTIMSAKSIQPAGKGLPHNNMQPYLSLNFCIALVGIYPQRN